MNDLDIDGWIEAGDTAADRDFRRAVHIVLTAISLSPDLPDHLIMKGGILLAIAHQGNRYTKDIDFSLAETIEEVPSTVITDQIKEQLPIAVEALEYDLNCRIQSSTIKPPGDNKHFQTLVLKIGYARFSKPKALLRLKEQGSPNTVRVECSFNEKITMVESFKISPDLVLSAYAVEDIIAEKIRALIQQTTRNRYRRQDVFDIHMLLQTADNLDRSFYDAVLNSLRVKSESRGITVTSKSMNDPEVRRRAEADYDQLKLELGESPILFEEAFTTVCSFYSQLPW